MVVLDPILCLQVGQLIKNVAFGDITEAVECALGWHEVAVTKAKIGRKLIQHRLAGGMDAEVLECELVVKDVGFDNRNGVGPGNRTVWGLPKF